MGSSNRLTPGMIFVELRARLGKASHWVLGLPPAIRWGAVVVVVSLAALLVYQRSTTLLSSEESFLYSGRRFSADDQVKIRRALERQRIGYRVDDRRIAVATDQLEPAAVALTKVEIGPRPLEEIRDASSTPRFMDTTYDRKLREQQGREKMLESMIGELPGIAGAFVKINRISSQGLRPTTRTTAYVYLETEGEAELPSRTIQAITAILTNFEEGLVPEAVTVLDRIGHRYLDAGNPALSVQSLTRAREEEVRQEILEKLDWIKGVRASVRLTAGSHRSELEKRGERSRTVSTDETIQGREVTGNQRSKWQPTLPLEKPKSQGQSSSPNVPVMALNRPIDEDEGLPPLPTAPDVNFGRLEESKSTLPESRIGGEPDGPVLQDDSDRKGGRGRVWVWVPRSFYYTAGMTPGRREPSHDELQVLMARTETQIRRTVKQVLPEDGLETWEEPAIEMFPDALPTSRPTTSPNAIDSRRLIRDWGIAGAVGALAASCVAIASWLLGSRRPVRRNESSPARVRYHRGTPGTQGPTERMLEFVRGNPEAAASVLERWIIRGGGPS